MRQTVTVVAMALAAGSLIAACGSGRLPVKTVATMDTGARCTAQVDEGNVSSWREVQSEGFTFCVPQKWQLDDQFQRLQSVRRRSDYRMVSWAAPDSTQRIVIDIPANKGIPTTSLQTAVALCATPYIVQIGEQTGCLSYPYDPLDPSLLPTCSGCGTSVTIFATARAYPRRSRFLTDSDFPVAGAAIRVVLSDPLIQIRAMGSTEAWRVIETVRPISASNGNH